MHFLALFVTSMIVAKSYAVDYVINPDKTKDFDGIAITKLHQPTYCDKRTKTGDRLKVHFNASLPDGKVFESTYVKEKPFEFIIGENMVINGFEYGLRDMCIGEKRHLMIPPKFAYGEIQMGSTVPARVTFHFIVELVDFTPNALSTPSNLFKTIDANEDGLLSRDEVKRYISNEKIAKGDKMVNMLKEIFQNDDQDSNGFIDHKEFGGVKHDEF